MEVVYRAEILERNTWKRTIVRKTAIKNVTVYCDVDWAGYPVDKRSKSGYCTFVWVI